MTTKPVNSNSSGASPQPRRKGLNLVPADQRHSLGGKVIGYANAGPRVRVGISLPDCRHHIYVCGPTGTGKTVLLKNVILDDVEAGRGVAAFDPAKGDLIRDLLDVLPADCGDRLVIVDPDETQAPPAINLLDPATHGGSPHDVAAHVTSVMAKVWSRWWGDRMTEFAYHGLLTLAYLPGSTLAHLPRLLSDAKWRAGRVKAVLDQLGAWEAGTLAEFWEGFNALAPRPGRPHRTIARHRRGPPPRRARRIARGRRQAQRPRTPTDTAPRARHPTATPPGNRRPCGVARLAAKP